MAIGVMILGASGTGKSYSIKGFSPEEVKIISVTKPILPFRGKYEIAKVDPMSDRIGQQVIRELENTDKKRVVIDDFQHILGRPMMGRIGEKGWDKYSEIQQPYADILNEIPSLPDDMIVYITSHTKTEDDGTVHCQTIGNAMDKYLTPEGLFMIVLGTAVNDGKYFFVTQNNGSNTLKSPEGMFPSMYIPNNLKYVDDHIRNYYYMDGAKTDEQMQEEDLENKVDESELKRGRRHRAADADTTPAEEKPKTRTRKRRAVEPAEDRYWYVAEENNVILTHGEEDAPKGGQPITKEQYDEAGKKIATEGSGADISAIMNPPTEEVPFSEAEEIKPEEAGITADGEHKHVSRRRRRV